MFSETASAGGHPLTSTITVARADLGAEVSRALIDALNEELSGLYPAGRVLRTFAWIPRMSPARAAPFSSSLATEFRSAAARSGGSIPEPRSSNECMGLQRRVEKVSAGACWPP